LPETAAFVIVIVLRRSSLALDEVPGMTFDDGQIRRRIDHDRSDIIGRIVAVLVSLPPETVPYSLPSSAHCWPRSRSA